jgi:hypothetical protein
MPAYTLSQLPDQSRLWIFASDKPLPSEHVSEFESRLTAIVDAWRAHGKALAAAAEVRYDQFVFVAADENIEAPSGCSIDSLTREIVQLGREFGVNFLSATKVFYRNGAEIVATDRMAFKALIESGDVTLDTIVFNNTLTLLSELRAGSWEVPMRSSWHALAFRTALEKQQVTS